MTQKEYLSQAYRLDQRINSKLEQIVSLNALATKCTSAITGMPHNPSPSVSTMADAVCKIVDLQTEIKHDVSSLVDLKREIVDAIKAVKDTECQTLLELRYLCYKSWEQIAVDMNFTVRNIHNLHKKALQNIDIPKNLH